jgi:predicted neuraminidase
MESSVASMRPGTMVFALASLAVLAACWKTPRTAPTFQFATPPESHSSEAAFIAHLLPSPQGTKEVHSAAMTLLPGGDRLSVFFGGSAEGATDVVLYQAFFRQGQWQTPTVLIGPEEVGTQERAYVRRVGNTSLHRDVQGRIHLFFVSVCVGGWAGSGINHMVSADNGLTWSKPRRLITSPFFNLSTLVRHPAVNLTGGGFVLPVYYELTNKFPELLYFDAAGAFVRKTRMDHEHGSLQPCVTPLDERNALALLRNRCHGGEKLLVQTTSDGGQTWTRPASLDVPNMDSPVAVASLRDGSLLLAYNPDRHRNVMMLAVSTDGVTWRDIAVLDRKPAEPEEGCDEYSYPTMLVEGDTIDLIYSHRRTGLRHIRLTTAWVQERRP